MWDLTKKKSNTEVDKAFEDYENTANDINLGFEPSKGKMPKNLWQDDDY